MEKIKLEILGLSSSQSQIGSYALVLGEEDGTRRLPIIIGGFEAQAIALEIENIKPNRPMTHDLLLEVGRAFDVEMEEVLISDLKEGVFFSQIVLTRAGQTVEVDARPSDAIALAVRYNAPVYVYDNILDEAGIIIREGEEDAALAEEEAQETAEERPSTFVAQEKTAPGISRARSPQDRLKNLTERMEEAIRKENYEEAARLRDEITKLEEQMGGDN